MQKIVPHLWFEKEAKEAAQFYADVFGKDSKVTSVTTLTDTPSGEVDTVTFEIWGYKFMAISAGPLFEFNPSMSFMVNFDPSQDSDARGQIDQIWEKLIDGGQVAMPLDKYPFSERYGWVQDKYGLSWQLILTDPKAEERPKIIPALLYVTDTCDKAEVATDFYLEAFQGAPTKDAGQTKRGEMFRYPKGAEPNKEGSVMFTDFMLVGQWFMAMDGSSEMHKFAFNEAVSLMISCKDQAEIDYFWDKLSAVPESEQCGWLKDKYGVSWQIVPERMDEMLAQGTPDQIKRVTQAFLQMKKFDLAKLEKAYQED